MPAALTSKQKHHIKTHYQTQSVKDMAKSLRLSEDSIAAYTATLPGPLSPAKKRLFTGIMIALPVVILLLLELMLQLMQYGGNLALFIPAAGEAENFLICNPDVSGRYFFMQSTRPTPSHDLLLKKKPENGLRVIVMGGSTTAGFPYGNSLMFSRILHKKLCDVFPQKRVEVVNTAMSAVNSYTLLDLTDEIIEQNPDLVLIYAGHNEYYGAMGVASMESLGKNRQVVKSYLAFKRFKTFILMRDIIGKLRALAGRSNGMVSDKKSTESLMARIVSDQEIPLDSALYQQGAAQFKGNMQDILKAFQQAGIPVMLSELVSNLSGIAPFVSVETETHPPASDLFHQAQQLESAGHFEQAKTAYVQAKDLDALRFRAPEAMNQIIHELGTHYNIPVVPMQSYFEAASPHGLVGNSVMTDHLHPTWQGYFIMAEAFFQAMRQNQFLCQTWPKEHILSISHYMQRWPITALDTLYAQMSIQYLKGGWPFQPKSKPNTTFQNFSPNSLEEKMAYRVMIKEENNLETAHLKLAEHYEQKQDFEKAFANYEALCHAVPQEPEFFEKAVGLAIKTKNYANARRLLTLGEQMRPTPFIDKWQGQLHLIEGNIGRAVPYLQKAMTQLPDDTQLLFNTGRALLLQLQFEKAKAIIDQLDQIPDAGRQSQKLKIEFSKVYTAFKPVSPLLAEADQLIKANNMDKAEAVLRKAQAQYSTPPGHHRLGMIYFKKNQPARACRELETARRLLGDQESILYHLTACYTRLNQSIEAKQTLNRLTALYPDFKDPYGLRMD